MTRRVDNLVRIRDFWKRETEKHESECPNGWAVQQCRYEWALADVELSIALGLLP